MIEIFAERLSALRKAEGLSVNELGKRVHISSSMISRYEAGERLPSYKALIKFAAYFKVTTDFLLGVETSSETRSKNTIDVTGLYPRQIEAVRMIVEQCKDMNGVES